MQHIGKPITVDGFRVIGSAIKAEPLTVDQHIHILNKILHFTHYKKNMQLYVLEVNGKDYSCIGVVDGEPMRHIQYYSFNECKKKSARVVGEFVHLNKTTNKSETLPVADVPVNVNYNCSTKNVFRRSFVIPGLAFYEEYGENKMLLLDEPNAAVEFYKNEEPLFFSRTKFVIVNNDLEKCSEMEEEFRSSPNVCVQNKDLSEVEIGDKFHIVWADWMHHPSMDEIQHAKMLLHPFGYFSYTSSIRPFTLERTRQTLSQIHECLQIFLFSPTMISYRRNIGRASTMLHVSGTVSPHNNENKLNMLKRKRDACITGKWYPGQAKQIKRYVDAIENEYQMNTISKMCKDVACLIQDYKKSQPADN